ncbi:MAG: hypothetical protein QF444_01650 [Phycisphaerales bacterium]|nr:hypothetical protein [Phycisphaerales bacterium]
MKRLIVSLIVAIAVLSITLSVLAWISWQSPSWYSPPDFSNPKVAKLADRAEYRFNEELHQLRPETEVWRIRIGDDAMNAWLSGRLEGWLTHDQYIELPPEIHNPQIHVTDLGLWTYAEVEITDGSTPRPLGIKWWIWVDDGNLFVEPIAVRLGKLPIPIMLFEKLISELREVADIKAVIPLLDDRTVEVQHIALENGAIVLTCRTKLH